MDELKDTILNYVKKEYLEEGDDRARVDARRAEEFVAILPGAAQRPLVRQHLGVGAIALQSEPCEEPALDALGICVRYPVALLVRVDRWMGVLPERAVRPPARQRPSGTSVSIVRAVSRLLDRQVEPDDVRRMAGDEALARRRVDHVIGRRHDRSEVTDTRRLVAQGAERSEIGHGSFRDDGTRPAGSGDDPIVRYVPRGPRPARREPAPRGRTQLSSGVRRPCCVHLLLTTAPESACRCTDP